MSVFELPAGTQLMVTGDGTTLLFTHPLLDPKVAVKLPPVTEHEGLADTIQSVVETIRSRSEEIRAAKFDDQGRRK